MSSVLVFGSQYWLLWRRMRRLCHGSVHLNIYANVDNEINSDVILYGSCCGYWNAAATTSYEHHTIIASSRRIISY